MKDIVWMDRYWKEVSTQKHGINVQYLYNIYINIYMEIKVGPGFQSLT